MIMSAVITEAEEGGFIALNPETGTTTQGETFDEAVENLREGAGRIFSICGAAGTEKADLSRSLRIR